MYKINFRINVTEHCNFNCDYCIEKSQQAKNRYNDFDIPETIKLLEKTIKKNKDRGVFISFFGGEPTLKKDKIMEFLETIKNKEYFKDLRFEITTNAYIFFPEFVEFCHIYNKIIKIMISYDGIGQKFRNKDKDINNTVRNNIIKYVKLFEKLQMNTSMISVNCCVVEDNADTIFDSFIDITSKGAELIKFSSVFTEHWTNDSFKKIYKEYKKIYEFVINTNKINNYIKYKLPTIDGGHKDEWKKFNSLFYQTKNDKDFVKKIDVSEVYYSEVIERRYKNKKHYKIKPLYIDKEIEEIKDIELQTLRLSSFNYTYFDKLTMTLLLGDNPKKYKHEIYCLFNFNPFLCNKYIKAIKRKIKKTHINIFEFMKKNQMLTYIFKENSIKNIEELKKFFDKDIIYLITKNKIKINNEVLELKISVENNSYIKSVIKNLFLYIFENEIKKTNIKINNNFIYYMSSIFYKYIYNIRSTKEVI